MTRVVKNAVLVLGPGMTHSTHIFYSESDTSSFMKHILLMLRLTSAHRTAHSLLHDTLVLGTREHGTVTRHIWDHVPLQPRCLPRHDLEHSSSRTGLGAGQSRAELRQPLEVAELAAGGARGCRPGALRQVAVLARHQSEVQKVEKVEKFYLILVSLIKPGSQLLVWRARLDGSVQTRNHSEIWSLLNIPLRIGGLSDNSIIT